MTLSGKKTLLVVAGPTASGKTAEAVRLALQYGTEVISADSRQFYREMSIGTAKPTPEEMRGVPHHFIDSLSIFDHYSVGDFEREALALLDRLFQKYDAVVMAGGSGLFIQAVCEGLDRFPDVPGEVRKKMEALYREKGLPFLQEYLQQVDPVYFSEVDTKNPHRLIRALAVYEASGKPFSHFRKGNKSARPFDCVFRYMDWERPELYRRIDARVDEMMQKGLLEEARRLFPHRNLNPLKTVGYQELFEHFEGRTGLEEAVALVKQHSRNYAKRQITWFKKYLVEKKQYI
jgi:tRNA dimethylallyltransferase